MLFSNALYYWQHNKLTDTERYADIIKFFDKNLALVSKFLEHTGPFFSFFPLLFDVSFETVPSELQSEIKNLHSDKNRKIISSYSTA